MSTRCANWWSSIRCCDCSLKTFGFLYGWFGVIWRTVATISLATLISRTTEYDPIIYDIVLITSLSYIEVSLVTNLFFIVGIQKEKPYFLLPFIIIGGGEILFALIIFIGGIRVILGLNRKYYFWYFIPVTLIVTGAYCYFWLKSIKLFRNMEVEITVKKEENARIASIRQSIANSTSHQNGN